MKKSLSVFVCFLILSCGVGNRNLKTINQKDFETLITQGIEQLVDVRTKDEFDVSHLTGAILIDVNEDMFTTETLEILDKSKPVYLYCRSGRRSMIAGTKLFDSGFKKVVVYNGNFSDINKELKNGE